MKKLRKIMAISIAMMMGCSLVACGGNEEGNTKDTISEEKEPVSVEKEEAVSVEGAASVEETESVMPSEEGETIYVYSWNEELSDRMQYFKESYPQYADRVECVNLDVGATSGDYTTTMETLLQGHYEDVEKYPSIVAFDESIALDFIQTDYTLPMSELGIGGEDFENMYPYTLDYATYEDEVKALAWQATPGVVCYRTDIAEWVLGSGEPEVVQEAISDWDKFFEMAETMKEYGYKMVSGPDDVKCAFLDSKTSPWVVDDTLNIDRWVPDYLEAAKKLYDGDYTAKTKMESAEWFANMDKDVFCYFGNTNFFYWGLNPEAHVGEYNICEGPSAFHRGGTYLTVSTECPDKDLAALILRTLCCDTETMAKMCEETNDFVNNKAAIESLINDGKGASDKCNGENPLPVFHIVAEKIDVKNNTICDRKCNSYVDEASEAYNTNQVEDVNAALEIIKDRVTEAYNYITVE